MSFHWAFVRFQGRTVNLPEGNTYCKIGTEGFDLLGLSWFWGWAWTQITDMDMVGMILLLHRLYRLSIYLSIYIIYISITGWRTYIFVIHLPPSIYSAIPTFTSIMYYTNYQMYTLPHLNVHDIFTPHVQSWLICFVIYWWLPALFWWWQPLMYSTQIIQQRSI